MNTVSGESAKSPPAGNQPETTHSAKGQVARGRPALRASFSVYGIDADALNTAALTRLYALAPDRLWKWSVAARPSSEVWGESWDGDPGMWHGEVDAETVDQ